MSDLAADYAFSQPPLDRADHLRDDLDALRALWPDAQVLLLDADGHALADADGHGHAPRRGIEIAQVLPEDAVFLGMHARQSWFAMAVGAIEVQGLARIDLRASALSLPAFAAGLHAHARALLHWRATHRFCGRCGAPLRFIRAGHAARCDGCNAEHYPRTDTAIIVAVSDGPRLLLGRQASWPPRRYSVIAGFLEPGERLEDAVVREVAEETGIAVRTCSYAGSQPWPFPGNLMVGFEAVADGHEPSFGGELEHAQWFTARQIHEEVAAGELLLSPRLSISSWLIRRWLARQAEAPAP